MSRSLLFLLVVLLSFLSSTFSSPPSHSLSIGTKPLPLVGRHDDSLAAYFSTLAPSPETSRAMQLGKQFKEVDIKARDGITLKAIVFDPPASAATNASSAGGKNPVVVFISSWGMNKWEYVVPGSEMAEKGYTVVSYTARGFWGSGGQINLAGALDMADISSVIDWTLANTNADPDRIGFSGISYGGGMSILGTAFDSRIRTATSMSCWIDLAQSMLGNGETIRKEGVRMLQLLAGLTGEVSSELATLFDDYFSNTDLDYMYAMTKNASAITFLDTINERQPNIFIGNAFGDSLFTPNQFPNFFNSLKGNKHMEFAPGDHAGPELPGLLGLPDQVWTRAYQWMDYYVRDAHTDQIASMPMVVMNTINSDAIESYNSWDAVTSGYANFQLSTKERLTSVNSDKDLMAGSDEVASIQTGEDANINGGLAFITATVRAYIQTPTHFSLDTIHKKYGAVFQTDRLSYTLRLRGNGKLKLNFIPKSSTSGTFIVYLLDVDEWGNEGKLITFSPWTFKNATPGKVNTVDIELTTTSYDLAARNKFAIVIATKDPLFLDQSPDNSDISFTSGSVISLPIHN